MFRLLLILSLSVLPYLYAHTQILRSNSVLLNAGGYGSFANAFCVHGNPAASVSFKTFTAGVYSERRFFLQGLDQLFLATVVPVQKGALGLSIKYLGGDALKQVESGLV
ncbi:MAG: hypothetical protein WCF67_05605, partial [Chitinophagaceae bacterium]